MKRIVDGLYRLESGGFVNSYLVVGSADLTLIDSGHSRSSQRLLAELKDNGFGVSDIGRIVLTHAHADHVGGVAAVLERHPVKIYAHPKEIPVLEGRERGRSFSGLKGFLAESLYRKVFPWTFMDSVFPLEPGDPVRGITQWQTLHTPGHTSGSLSFYNPVKQVLICGDVMIHREGRLQLPDACFNSNGPALQRSIQDLAKLDTDILCPGHGPTLRGGAFRYIEALLARRRTR